MPPSEAQRRAHQKHEAERPKRSAIWLEPALAKKVDRAMKRLGLPSRVAWVEHCLKAVSDEVGKMSTGTDITEADVPTLLRAWCAIYEGDPEFVKRPPDEQSSIRLTLYIGSMAALEKAGALAWPVNVAADADNNGTTGGR